jgi:hypothetical protein
MIGIDHVEVIDMTFDRALSVGWWGKKVGSKEKEGGT